MNLNIVGSRTPFELALGLYIKQTIIKTFCLLLVYSFKYLSIDLLNYSSIYY